MAAGGGVREKEDGGERDDTICESRRGPGARVLFILMLKLTHPRMYAHIHPKTSKHLSHTRMHTLVCVT